MSYKIIKSFRRKLNESFSEKEKRFLKEVLDTLNDRLPERFETKDYIDLKEIAEVLESLVPGGKVILKEQKLDITDESDPFFKKGELEELNIDYNDLYANDPSYAGFSSDMDYFWFMGDFSMRYSFLLKDLMTSKNPSLNFIFENIGLAFSVLYYANIIAPFKIIEELDYETDDEGNPVMTEDLLRVIEDEELNFNVFDIHDPKVRLEDFGVHADPCCDVTFYADDFYAVH